MSSRVVKPAFSTLQACRIMLSFLFGLISVARADYLFTQWNNGNISMPYNSIKGDESCSCVFFNAYSTAKNPIGYYDNVIYLISM